MKTAFVQVLFPNINDCKIEFLKEVYSDYLEIFDFLELIQDMKCCGFGLDLLRIEALIIKSFVHYMSWKYNFQLIVPEYKLKSIEQLFTSMEPMEMGLLVKKIKQSF